MDSTIRIRQLNQPELSGFVSGVFNFLPKINISGSLISSGSGIADIGSLTLPYSKVFANQLDIASGSGINFGDTSFRAYNSGGFAYVDIGGTTISSSGENIYIQGPSGVAGPSGADGPTGVSGIGVTGISYDTSNKYLNFTYSNGDSTGFYFSGLSGATGVSVTGFFQSGYYIFPQYDHFKGTGKGILMLAGPEGPPGSISLFFKSGGALYSNTNFPSSVVIDPYYDSGPSPDISMMRGMSYSMDASGLNTHELTSADIALMQSVFSGQYIPFVPTEKLNYFTSGTDTGYWRFSLFPSATATGFYSGSFAEHPTIFSESTNFEAFSNNTAPNLYRTKLSAVTSFTAKSEYTYGFMVYTLQAEESASDHILQPIGYAYVLGNAHISSGIGPAGPQGPSGAGVQGPSGDIGLQGNDGDPGPGISSYTYSGNGDNVYIKFILENGAPQDWIPLPAGGPPGASGASGVPGSLINVFLGEYAGGITYPSNATITRSGSCYINTGVSFSNIAPPDPTWMLIASGGSIGPSGESGASGDVGSLSNHFSGAYSAISAYPTNYVVTLGGSTYINTGVLTTPGSSPPTSPWQMLAQKGDQGNAGAGGVPSLLRATGYDLRYGNGVGTDSDNKVLDPLDIDIFTLTFTAGDKGNDYDVEASRITFSGDDHFQIGKSVLVNVRNVDCYRNAEGLALFAFTAINVDGNDVAIKWPNNIYYPPNAGTSNIYTILRFADESSLPAFYGTYSNPYSL